MPPVNENEEPIQEETQPEAEDNAEGVQSEPETKERPEVNYQREIERRKAEADRLRYELEAEKAKQVNRRDQNDISTWTDNELVNVKNDPNAGNYRQQAEDILFERKMARVLERDRQNTKRTNSEMELRTKYPEALDQSSAFAAKMEQVMYDLELQKSPAGRLAAARIVAGETSKGTGKSPAAGRKQEESRLKDVKQTLTEGDRPDPRPNMANPKKAEDIEKRIKAGDHKAVGDALAERGISRDAFFGPKK